MPGSWRKNRPRVEARKLAGGLLVGMGVGALVDGFVLHQLLRWHHLISSKTPDTTVAGLERNTLADGIFHTVALVVLLLGLMLLIRHPVEPRPLLGLALAGWGVFNIADQLVFHLALGAHHIREDVTNYELYDWAFFALGVLLALAGSRLARSSIATRGRPSGRSR